MNKLLPKTLLNVARRTLLRQPWHTVLMIVGIALGVAVIVAIDLANASATKAFKLSTESIAGRATHSITGGPSGIDVSFYRNLLLSDLQAPAAPVITEYVSSPQLGGKPLQLLGVDPIAEIPFRDYFQSGSDLQAVDLAAFFTRPGALFISSDLAGQYGIKSGEPITLTIAGSIKPVFIAGILEAEGAIDRRALEGLLLADIATAQEITGRLESVDRIDLILPTSKDSSGQRGSDLEEELLVMLPTGAVLSTVGTRTETIQQMTAAFQTNLTALSLLALVVGLFLIYNTMTFSVVQRRELYGSLRALGVTRREIVLLVGSEALIASLLGSAIGVALGVVLGQGAIRLVSQTINDLYFVITVRDIPLNAASLIKGGLMGILASALAVAPPAWEAASVPPRAALSRSGLEDKTRKKIRSAAVTGILSIVAGAGLLFLPTRNLYLSFGATSIVIIGFALLTPLATEFLMRVSTGPAGRLFGALGRMATRSVIRSSSRTSIAIAALMIAVSVTIGVSVMIGSFRSSVVDWLGQSMRGDIYLSPPALVGSQYNGVINPAVLDILESWPGVKRVDTFRSGTAETPSGPITLSHTQNPNVGAERIFKWTTIDKDKIWDAMMNGAVIVSEPFANRVDLKKGGRVTIITPGGTRAFPVVGVYTDFSSSQGIVLMAHPVYRDIWNDDTIGAASLRLSPGVDPDSTARELSEALAPIQQLVVRPNATLRSDVLAIFDRTFAITTAMQLLATVTAFIGVLSALLSIQLDKKREFGILRALGLTKQQLRRLIGLETGLMGAAAGFISIPSGLALSLILIFIINRRAFGWTLQFHFEIGALLQAFVIAVLAALLAGIYPAIKIGRMEIAEAMRYE